MSWSRDAVLWGGLDEEAGIDAVFLIVKDGGDGVAVASPGYMAEVAHSIFTGDLKKQDAFDHLLVVTADSPMPRQAWLRVTATGVEVLVASRRVVHRFGETA